MTSAVLIEAARTVEPVVAAVVAVILLALFVRRLTTSVPVAATTLDAPIARRTELALLAIVVTVALAVRVVGWDSAWTPAFWFSEVSTLFVDQWTRAGALWIRWTDELRSTTVLGPHDAAIVLPVLAGLQALVGPRFGLPVLCGAVFGTLSVVLAWALGRRMRSAAFGLLFEAPYVVGLFEVAAASAKNTTCATFGAAGTRKARPISKVVPARTIASVAKAGFASAIHLGMDERPRATPREKAVEPITSPTPTSAQSGSR